MGLSWSATAGSNAPSGGTLIGANLNDNLQTLQSVVRAAGGELKGQGHGWAIWLNNASIKRGNHGPSRRTQ